jgi:hypothetical protein
MRRVLVLGIPRSGTTWVAQALGRTSGATYVHEPDGDEEPFAFRARYHDKLLHYPVLTGDDAAPEYARLWYAAFEGVGSGFARLRRIVAKRAFSRSTTDDRRRAMSAHTLSPWLRIAVAGAAPRVPAPGAEAVVVKSVNAPLSGEWVARRFTPRVLIVTRDLRNVMASWMELWAARGPTPAMYDAIRAQARRRWDVQVPPTDDPVEGVATLCAVMMLALVDTARARDWTVLSHEDACVDSAAKLSAIAATLGLEWGDAAEAYLDASNRPGAGYATQRVSEDLPEQWRTKLGADTISVIEHVVERFPTTSLTYGD